jgi:hypothetical protein
VTWRPRDAPAVYDEYHGVALQVVVLPHVAVAAGACAALRSACAAQHGCTVAAAVLPDMSMAVKLMLDCGGGGGGGCEGGEGGADRRSASLGTLENASMLMPTVGVASTTAVFFGLSCERVSRWCGMWLLMVQEVRYVAADGARGAVCGC